MSNRPSLSPGAAHRRWVIAAVEAHEQRLVRFAARLLGDEEAARDVVQHAFMQLCRQPPEAMKKFDNDNGLARWLFRVTRHRAVDLVRQARRHPPCDGQLTNELDTAAMSHNGETPGPHERAEQRELGELLLQLVDGLPTAQRENVLLWAEGWSSSEIGEITGRAAATVRVHLHKAFATLRKHPAVRRLNVDEPAVSES